MNGFIDFGLRPWEVGSLPQREQQAIIGHEGVVNPFVPRPMDDPWRSDEEAKALIEAVVDAERMDNDPAVQKLRDVIRGLNAITEHSKDHKMVEALVMDTRRDVRDAIAALGADPFPGD